MDLKPTFLINLAFFTVTSNVGSSAAKIATQLITRNPSHQSGGALFGNQEPIIIATDFVPPFDS